MNNFTFFLKRDIHHKIYVFLLMCFAFLIPIANKWINITFLLIFFNWLIEGDFSNKYKRLMQRPALLFMAAIYLLFLASFFYTSIATFRGINFLIFEFPLLVMPLIIASSKPISTRYLRSIMWVYILSNLWCTFLGMNNFFRGRFYNMRDISPFIHHVRFGLNILLCIFTLFFFVIDKNRYTTFGKMVLSLLIVWFIFYLFFARTLTAMLILPLCIFVYFLCYQKYQYRYTKPIVISVLSVLGLCGSIYIITLSVQYWTPKQYTKAELSEKTIYGNTYPHDTNSIVENGSGIYMVVCEKELEIAWNERSHLKYDSLIGNFTINQTLIRYLNSKGLKKDMEGVYSLSDKDIERIENGTANVDHSYKHLVKSHLYPILFGYDIYKKYHRTLWSSVFQRLELWETSYEKVKERPWFGYGVGSPNPVVKAQLKKNRSLLYEVINPPHCQFFSYLLS